MNRFFSLFISLYVLVALNAADKPNILVLMFEDTSEEYLSAFGNTVIETPNFDKLAEEGVLFVNAYSNGPQCSPARSTFIRGMYATSVGAEWHRMDVMTPDDFYFPRLLQKEGYKTYLKGKHDFNSPKATWNDKLKIFDGTDYTTCPEDVPFYGQYNFFDTHMSRITNTRFEGQRDDRTVFASDVDSVFAYIPPTEWVVDDHAYHLHKVRLFDEWLKTELDKLKATGRDDNTIIFVTSDHGGCLPGSKGYIREAGVEVPLIAYYPPKWEHLKPENVDGVCDEIVEFADFGPTIFSLADLNKPAHMQGRAFCGNNREEPKEFAYLYKANQAPNFIPARGITDAKYKIIWNYNTVFPSGARQDFQWKMPGYRDWETHWRQGEYSGIYSYFFEPMQAIEFYDLQSDPEETVNLVNDPAYASLVEEYKTYLKTTVRETGDLGFFPQSLRSEIFTQKPIYDIVQEGFDMEPVYQAAELASMAEADDVDALLALMQSPETVIRYWGSVGMLRLRFHNKIVELPALVKQIANSEGENIEVRCINHCSLLSDEQYCEVVDFFRDNMTDEFCKGIIHNMGNKLRPIAAELFKGFDVQNFYTRSLMINAGLIPYEEIIDHPDLTIDSSYIEQSDTLNCEPPICHNHLYDDFSTDDDLLNWIETPINNMMSLSNEALRVLFDKTKENTTARRSFEGVRQNTSFSIKYKSDNTTSRTYFSLLNQDQKPVAAFLIGVLEQVNGAYAITALNDNGAKVEKGNMAVKSNFIPDVFQKDKYYTILFDVDFSDKTFTISVDGQLSESYPLIQSCTSIVAYDIYVEKMYNSGESGYFDDFTVTANAAFKNELQDLVSESQVYLYAHWIDFPTDEESITAWQHLNEAFLYANDVLKDCETSEGVIKATAVELQTTLEVYKALDIAALDERQQISATDFSLPQVFYIGSGTFAPEFNTIPLSYHFEVYDINGGTVFTTNSLASAWQGATQSPIYLWRLTYQLPGNSTQTTSGKVMVFVD